MVLAENNSKFIKMMVKCKKSLNLRMIGIDKYPYEDVQKIGQGGYGSIFKVKNTEDGKYYVAKKQTLSTDMVNGKNFGEWRTLNHLVNPDNTIVDPKECFFDLLPTKIE